MLVLFYTLSHPRTGEVRYVGQTVVSLRERLSGHKSGSKRDDNHNARWIRSLAAEGLEPVITELDRFDGTQEWADKIEVEWIALFGKDGRLTNATDGGKATGCRGYKHTPEVLAKLSADKKGIVPQYLLTPEVRAKAARWGENNHQFGKSCPEEQRLRVSAKMKGRPATHLIGKLLSEEHKKNLKIARAKQIRKPCSPETKAKISAAKLAKGLTKQGKE